MNIVGTATALNSSAAATISATPHGSTAVGDVVFALLIINAGASSSQTPGTGFSLVGYADQNGGNDRLLVYKKLMASSGDLVSYTFTNGLTTNMALALVSVRGPFAVEPVEAYALSSPASSTQADPTVEAPTVTALTKNGILLCVWSAETATTWSTPAGMTDLFDIVTTYGGGNNVSMSAAAEAIPTAGATGVRTSTANTGDSQEPMTASLYIAPPGAVGGLFWANNF